MSLQINSLVSFYLPSWLTVENLVEDAEDVLFSRVLNNENHVLYPLLPDRNQHGYELQRRRHDRTLTSNDNKRNFIYRQIHTKHLGPRLSHILSLYVRLRFVYSK